MKLVLILMIAMGAVAHADDLFDTISLGNDQTPPPVATTPAPVATTPAPVVVARPQPVRVAAAPPRAVTLPAPSSRQDQVQNTGVDISNFKCSDRNFTSKANEIDAIIKDTFHSNEDIFTPGKELVEDTATNGNRCHFTMSATPTAQLHMLCSSFVGTITAPAKVCKLDNGGLFIKLDTSGVHLTGFAGMVGSVPPEVDVTITKLNDRPNHIHIKDNVGHVDNSFTAN